MTATVDIIIKATDKASKTINDTNKGLGKMKDGLNDVVQGLTGFNLGTMGLVGGIVAVGNEIKNSVIAYTDYAEAMDKMSMSTGMSVEETSRLVQVSDDLRIAQGDVEQAMKLALQNGVNPSIDSMAKISDQYRQFTDPAQRAAAMQDIFGKSWEKMVPLLEQGGQAIRDAAAEMDKGMIVTKEGAAQAREYAKAMDDYGDAVTGAKNKLAQDLLPTLTDGINILMRTEQATKDSGTEWMNWIPTLGGARSAVLGVSAAIENHTEKTKKAEAEAEDWTDAEKKAMRAVFNGTEAIQEATRAVRPYTDANDDLVVSLRDEGAAADNAALKHQNLAARREDEIAALDGLQGAYDGLRDAQLNWMESAGNQTVSLLDESAMNAQRYLDGLGAADEVFGTATKRAEEQERAMEAANKQYQATGDLQAYKTKLLEIKDTYLPLDETVKSSTALVETFAEQWNALENKSLKLSVYVDDHSGEITSLNKPKKHGGETDGATGLDLVVPPGHPADSYKIGVTSGEHVTVTPSGRDAGSTGGGITIGTIVLPGVKNAQQLLTELGKLSARAQKSGQQYAGSY
jgi:hypothetical protein